MAEKILSNSEMAGFSATWSQWVSQSVSHLSSYSIL